MSQQTGFLFFFNLSALFLILNLTFASGQTCSSFDTCVSCTEQPNCGFCETSATCIEGTIEGPTNGLNCTNWLYDSCPQAPCEEYTNCKSCIADEFCGWCATTGLCMEGDEASLFGSCPDWRQDEGVPCDCGDGIIEPEEGEECDDGNTDDNDGCSSRCIIEYCGDGIINDSPLEQCDDGNDVDNDACSNLCQLNCGNGRVDIGEECDDGNQNDHDTCTTNCTANICGNGRIDSREECDDGNNNDTDSCSNVCTSNVCGNRRVDPGEECDDGNSNNNDFCTNQCTINDNPHICGNGIVDPGEECDDGNNNDTYYFCVNCVVAYCGDGTLFTCNHTDSPNCVPEECDDGNNNNRDGCSATCKIEILSNQFFPQVEDSGLNFGVTFSFSVDFSLFNSTTNFSCSEIFLPNTTSLLGEEASCTFRNSTYLVVFMGIEATILIGDIVEIRPNLFPLITESNYRSELFPPDNPVKPFIMLLGPSQVNCQETQIWDAAGSYGSGGRKFVNKYWVVTPALPALDLSQDFIVINRRDMVQKSYNITYAASNWLGMSSASTIIVSVVSNSTLTVEILGGAEITMDPSKGISLTAKVSNYCKVTVNELFFAWSRQSGPLITLPASSSVTSQLYLPRGTFIGNSTYVIRVDVSNSVFATASTIGSDTITIHTSLDNIVAVLLPGDRLVSTASEINLDASASYDPAYLPGELKYSWNCSTFQTSDPCPIQDFLLDSKGPLILVPPYNIPPGKYSIDVAVTKDTRTGVASNLVEFSFSVIPEIAVRILPQSNSVLTKTVTSSSPISIEGFVLSAQVEIATFSWTLTTPSSEVFLDPDFFGPIAGDGNVPDTEFLYIAPFALTGGVEYTATLTVVDFSGFTGSASVSFYVGSLPVALTDEPCSVTPKTAVAGSTFTVSCSNIETPEIDFVPILYDFLWTDGSGTGRLLLGSAISGQASFKLPSSAEAVLVRAKDAVGSYIEFSLDVTVTSVVRKRGILSYDQALYIFEQLLPPAVQEDDMDLIYQLLTELLIQLGESSIDQDTNAKAQMREDVAQIIQDELILYPTDTNIEAQLYLLALLVEVPTEITTTTASIVVEEVNDLLSESESNDVVWTSQSWEYAYTIVDNLFLAVNSTTESDQETAALLNDLARYQGITQSPSSSSVYDQQSFYLQVRQSSPSRLPSTLSDNDSGATVTFSSDFKEALAQTESYIALAFITYKDPVQPFPGSDELAPNSVIAALFLYHLSGSPISPAPAPFEISLRKLTLTDRDSACQVWSGEWSPSCDLVSSDSSSTKCSCDVMGEYSSSPGAVVTTSTTTGSTGSLEIGEYHGEPLDPYPTDKSDDDDYDTGVIGFTVVAAIIALLLLGILSRLRSTKHPKDESSEIKKPDIELGPVLKDKTKKKAYDVEGAGLSPTDSSSGEDSRLRKPTRKGKIITFIHPDEESDAESSKASATPSPSSSEDDEPAAPLLKGSKPDNSDPKEKPQTEKQGSASPSGSKSGSKSSRSSKSAGSRSRSKSGSGSGSGSHSE